MTLLNWIAYTLLVSSSSVSTADQDRTDLHEGLRLLEENDAFGAVRSSDDHYTQGLRLEYAWQYGHEGDQGLNSFEDVCLSARYLYSRTLRERELIYGYSLVVDQNMYTPRDITETVPNPKDRPFAGWLYVGLKSTMTDLRQVGDIDTDAIGLGFAWRDSFELDLGVIGPSAQGREVQSWFHRIIHGRHPTWVGQLPDEAGFLLSWDRRWIMDLGRIPGTRVNALVVPHLGVQLGNVFTDVSLGARLMAGYNTPRDFDVGLMNPSVPMADDSSALPGEPVARSASYSWSDFSFYGFAGPEGRAVGRNEFLDGTLFRQSLHIGRNWLVADLSAGVAIRLRYCTIAFTQTLRSPEIRGDSTYHNYGQISLTVMF